MGFPHWVKLWWLTPFSEPGRTMSVTGTKQITAAFKTGHTYNSCYLDATIAAQHSTHVTTWAHMQVLRGCLGINYLGMHELTGCLCKH